MCVVYHIHIAMWVSNTLLKRGKKKQQHYYDEKYPTQTANKKKKKHNEIGENINRKYWK